MSSSFKFHTEFAKSNTCIAKAIHLHIEFTLKKYWPIVRKPKFPWTMDKAWLPDWSVQIEGLDMQVYGHMEVNN